MSNHEFYMKRAIELARGGWGRTNPNPLVGALIVKDGKIIAEGFHESYGMAHAEVVAIQNAHQEIRDTTLYVNLEPCSHYGKTPPCVKAIIESGVSEVVVAMVDPNPLVAGNGIRMLKDAGVRVVEGVLEHEARILNEIFITYISKKKPFVIMKTAMTLDGKICSSSGDSKWISGERSRHYVHTLRDRVAAVMVGKNTILKDNPFLTTRLVDGNGKDAIRIVVDSNGAISENCNAITVKSNAGVILATTSAIPFEKEKILQEKKVQILKLEDDNGRVDLNQLMNKLYTLGIDSVLLEGGGNLNASALASKIVDKVMFFISPKIIGGRNALTPVEGVGIQNMRDALEIKNISVTTFDDDLCIEGYTYFHV